MRENYPQCTEKTFGLCLFGYPAWLSNFLDHVRVLALNREVLARLAPNFFLHFYVCSSDSTFTL